MRGGRTVRATVLLLVLLTAYPPNRLTAQDDPRLQAAVQLAQQGRGDSARALVRALLAGLSPADSLYPQALFTAGILGADAQAITTNLQRVVVEYGRSPWADDALVRLAQFHFVNGDNVSAAQSVERLRRDYPDSPHVARGDLVGARAYFLLGQEPQGCELVREALARAGDDVELQNQVSFYAGRCPAPAANDPAVGESATPAPRGYYVQVLAVRSATQVDEMLTRLKVMGFEARVARDTTGFLKVRVGPYATRAEADRARDRLRTRLGGEPFVVEER